MRKTGKYFIKIIITMLIALLLFSIMNNYIVEAGSVRDFSGNTGNTGGAEDAMVKVLSAILNVTRIIGTAIAIIMLMIVACKYILASAGDKADIKKYAFNYITGAIVLFGASGIVSILRDIVLDQGSE